MKLSGRVPAGVVAALAVALALPQPAEATFPGLNGRIGYSLGGNNAGIYLSDLGQVSSGQDGLLAWSPSGTRMAYLRFGFGIFVAKADGSNAFVIVGNNNFFDGNSGTPQLSNITWDATGQDIWFTVTNTLTNNGIWKISANGGAPTRVLANLFQGNATSLNWSRPTLEYPRGRLVFGCNFRDALFDICVYEPPSDLTEPITAGILVNVAVDQTTFSHVNMTNWAPDGEHITFIMTRAVPFKDTPTHTSSFADLEIFSIGAHGDGLTQLTQATLPPLDGCPNNTDLGLIHWFYPRYSPDGSLILAVGEKVRMNNINGFCVLQGYAQDLYLLPKSGGSGAPIPGTSLASNPDWQPLAGDLTISFDDGHGNPLEGMYVELFTAAETLVDDNPVNIPGTGDYIFAHVPAGEYKIRATLVDHAGASFDIRHADTPGDAAWVEYSHSQVGGLPQQRDISFGQDSDLVTFNIPLSAKDKLDDLANIYFRLYQFVGWVKQKLTPTTGTLVNVYAFATVDPLNGSALPGSAYYTPGGSYIVIDVGDSDYANRQPGGGGEGPENDEWHEFTHHLFFTFINSSVCSGTNHAGYNNPDTCDSMDEGFATFLPAFASRDIDHTPDSDYDNLGDLEEQISAWAYWADKPHPVLSGVDTSEDLAVASLFWDVVDGNADTKDSEVIGTDGLHHPVTYTDAISVPIKDLWTQLTTHPNLDHPIVTVRDLRDSFGQPALTIDLDGNGVADVSPLDVIFLMHGFYPITNDQTITATHVTYHYDVRFPPPGFPLDFNVGRTDHQVFDANGAVVETLAPRFNRPSQTHAFLDMHVNGLSGSPLAGSTVNLKIHYPGGRETTVRTRLGTGSGDLVHIELPPYFDYLLPNGAPLPACNPSVDRQVQVEVTASMAGINSLENPTFDNCGYLQAMATATTPAALAYTLTVPVYTLNLDKTGTGTGTIKGGGAYPSGQTVTVSATPDIGTVFAGWTGPDAAECATGSVVMNADKHCTATFTATTYTLTVSKAGTGHGTVTGGGTYGAGATATVSASVDFDSNFDGWSGPNAAECASGSVLMNADKSCTATFTIHRFALTLSVSPPGTGFVSGGGVYDAGTTVTVSATPFIGNLFSGWSGPDAAECATGSVFMGSPKSCTANFVVDTVPPTGSISINNGAAATNSKAVTLNLTCSDPSECFQMQFSNTGTSGWSKLQPFSPTAAWTLSSGDGVKTVYVRFSDDVGNTNTTPFSDQITLDATAPTGSIVINGNAAGTNSTSVTLTLTCTDAGTGCSQMQFSNDGTTYSALEPFATTRAWTLASASGKQTVYVRFQDGAGNLSTAKSDQISVDAVPPTGSVSVSGGATYATSAAVTLTLTCSDTRTGTGCSQMQFSNDGITFSAPQPFATSATWTLSSGDGAKTVSARFIDGAGNVSAISSDQITLDATTPAGSVVINNGDASTTSRSVTLTLTCTDTGTGCSQMQFSDNGTSGWSKLQPFSTSAPYTLPRGSGTKTVFVRFTDVAGNLSANASDSIVLQ